jgi:hypothetical protein
LLVHNFLFCLIKVNKAKLGDHDEEQVEINKNKTKYRKQFSIKQALQEEHFCVELSLLVLARKHFVADAEIPSHNFNDQMKKIYMTLGAGDADLLLKNGICFLNIFSIKFILWSSSCILDDEFKGEGANGL